MSDDEISGALKAMFPMIAERLKRAHGIAEAANACAVSGQFRGSDADELSP